MNKKDFLNGIYEDFFGIGKIEKENQKLAEELGILDKEIPEIVVEQKEKKPVILKEEKDKKMQEWFEKIDKLYIEEYSKNILKKIIEYIRKYDEKIEKEYINFNFCIYSNNEETINKITEIIRESCETFNYVKSGRLKEISLYDIDSIENIFNADSNVILLQDFENLNNQEAQVKDKFMHKLDEELSKNSENTIAIVTAKNMETINIAFEKNENLKEKYFEFEIVGTNPDVQDVYQEILNRLKNNMEFDEEFQIKLLDYISATYPNNSSNYPEYRNNLCKKILFNKEIPEYEKEKSMDEIFAELNELVGLEKVKNVLKDLVNLMELKNKSKDDLKISNINLHMVFLGNPGTGKTTVARIVAQILYNLKYIKQNKLIEVSSKDLVAEYVGQTAPKTMAVIERALGGVLFVDEAYSLASGQGQGNSYNEEAIATLIQAMENNRDNLVVIFAGYTKEMQAFLDANSGIVSRIGYTLEFDDYTTEELIQIFKGMIKKSGFVVTDDAIEKVREIIEEYKNTKNFGNARFVRSIFEKTIVKHASNTKGKKGKKILKTIVKEDISAENLLKMLD